MIIIKIIKKLEIDVIRKLKKIVKNVKVITGNINAEQHFSAIKKIAAKLNAYFYKQIQHAYSNS